MPTDLDTYVIIFEQSGEVMLSINGRAWGGSSTLWYITKTTAAMEGKNASESPQSPEGILFKTDSVYVQIFNIKSPTTVQEKLPALLTTTQNIHCCV